MKRILTVLLALVIPLLLVVSAAYALYRPGPPPEVQALVDQFVAFENRHHPGTAATKVQPAPWPEQLNARSAVATFSTDGYYCTTYGPGDPILPITAALTGTEVGQVEGTGCNVRVIPYPSHVAWCVTLSGTPSKALEAQAAPSTVIVARHDDMYTARWIVHVPASNEAMCAVCGCPPR